MKSVQGHRVGVLSMKSERAQWVGGGSDMSMNTMSEQPAVAQPQTAEHGREIGLETFRKANISNHPSGEIK